MKIEYKNIVLRDMTESDIDYKIHIGAVNSYMIISDFEWPTINKARAAVTSGFF